MKQAGQRLRKLILDENQEQANDDVLDVAVTFDGTWAKRGFTSLTGVVFVLPCTVEGLPEMCYKETKGYGRRI
jgi:hypothetical protein